MLPFLDAVPIVISIQSPSRLGERLLIRQGGVKGQLVGILFLFAENPAVVLHVDAVQLRWVVINDFSADGVGDFLHERQEGAESPIVRDEILRPFLCAVLVLPGQIKACFVRPVCRENIVLAFFKHTVGFFRHDFLQERQQRLDCLSQGLPLFPADRCVFLCLVILAFLGGFVFRRRVEVSGVHNPVVSDGKMQIRAVHHTVYGIIFHAHERHILPFFHLGVSFLSTAAGHIRVGTAAHRGGRGQCQHAYQDERRQNSFVCAMPDDVRFSVSPQHKHHALPTKRNP